MEIAFSLGVGVMEDMYFGGLGVKSPSIYIFIVAQDLAIRLLFAILCQ